MTQSIELISLFKDFRSYLDELELHISRLRKHFYASPLLKTLTSSYLDEGYLYLEILVLDLNNNIVETLQPEEPDHSPAKGLLYYSGVIFQEISEARQYHADY